MHQRLHNEVVFSFRDKHHPNALRPNRSMLSLRLYLLQVASNPKVIYLHRLQKHESQQSLFASDDDQIQPPPTWFLLIILLLLIQPSIPIGSYPLPSTQVRYSPFACAMGSEYIDRLCKQHAHHRSDHQRVHQTKPTRQKHQSSLGHRLEFLDLTPRASQLPALH